MALHSGESSVAQDPLNDDMLIRPDALDIEPVLFKNAIRGRWNGRLVVVKKLAVDVSEELLKGHARKWLQLDHPNVSRICGIADHDSDPLFIVLPFHSHGNIRQFLAAHSRLDRRKMILDVASGMQYLHHNGVVHGGLRPNNILITDDEHVVLSEYGMFELQQSTRDPEAHRYFSPEAWKGTSSRPSDTYAFAMCAMEIFTSTLPWGALSEKHIYHLVMYENARPERPDESQISDDLWSIIISAWHPDPRSRPAFDLIVRLWRVSTSQIDYSHLPATDTSDSLDVPPLNRYHSGVSVGSNRSLGSGPPAYDERVPVSAPPGLQQFAINRNDDMRNTAQRLNTPHSYSWYSSTNSRSTTQDDMPTESGDPSSAPALVQQFSSNLATSPMRRPPSPSYSWYSSVIPVNHQSSGSSSSGRSVDTPIPFQLEPSLFRSQSRTSIPPKRTFGAVMTPPEGTSVYDMSQSLGQSLPRVEPKFSQDDYPRRWELSSATYSPHRQQSLSEISIENNSRRSTAVLLVGALQAELNGSRKADIIDTYLVKIYQSASESDTEAQRLITAGAAPALIHLLKTRAAEMEGLEIVLITLGCLAHDSISANMLYRTNTALTLIELCKASISTEISCLAIWCLSRICRSAEVSQGLIRSNVVAVLLKQCAIGDLHTASMSVYCLGTLVQNDAIAEFLSTMDIIPLVIRHLRESTESSQRNTDHICAGLYATARISRSIKLAKSLAKAGCVDLISHHLITADNPDILHWSARAVGCLMRPNSSDMAKILLEADIAKGLARLPTVLGLGNLQALGSLGFAVQRFSCAEWSGKIRQSLVDAGVVDALLAALRTAAEEPCYDVHVELALAVSLLGDVGGSSIRKEIVNAGGISILKSVSSGGNAEVAKACNMAITSVTGNIWTRNAASAKTAMAHNWNGGCPEYQPPAPFMLRLR